MNPPRAASSIKGMSLKRVLGVGLMIFSALGVVIGLLGLLVVANFSRQVALRADEAIMLTDATLDSTSQSLDVVHSTLGEARDALGAMQAITNSTDEGLQKTGALIGSLSDALGGDLAQVVSSSQESLSAAEEGAALVEQMLYALNVISPLTGAVYDPDVSLTESLALMNESLGSVPETLDEVEQNLNAVQENLNSVQTGITGLTDTLSVSESLLAEPEASINGYKMLVQQLSLQVSDLKQSLPTWIRTATFVLYFLVIWLIISQIGLLWQGWEMVSYDHRQVEDKVRELETEMATLQKQVK